MDLPGGLTSRPLASQDAKAVFAIAAAEERHDLGKVEIELADIVSDWQRPSFDVRASTLGVLDGDDLVAYAQLTSADRADAGVLPAYRRRGIGTVLAQWIRERARECGASVVGTAVPSGSPADRLLESLGYRVRWTSWVLHVPEGREIAPRPLPAGYVVRAAAPEEHPAVHEVIEDAFLEWSVRERSSYEDFVATTMDRPGFEPWNLRVVTDPSGVVVGAAVVLLAGELGGEAYVDRLAVRCDQRRQGLGQAMLVDAFAQGRAHGAARSGLATDSRTGALDLYLKVGMEVGDVWLNRAVDL